MTERVNIVGIAMILIYSVALTACALATHGLSNKIDMIVFRLDVHDRQIEACRVSNQAKKGPLDQAKESEIYLRLQTLERAQTHGTQGKETSQPDSGLPQE